MKLLKLFLCQDLDHFPQKSRSKTLVTAFFLCGMYIFREDYDLRYPHLGQTPFSFREMPQSGQRSMSFLVSNS